MRDPLPDSIDPRHQLGIAAGKLAGIWPADKCQRVLELLSEPRLSDVVVEFNLVESGQYIKLDGRIYAELALGCQRCLQTVIWKLDEPLKLMLVPQGMSESLEEGYEPLELDEHGCIPTGEWIEEEIILRIPNAPVHDRIQDCDPEMLKRAREFDLNSELQNEESDNPFDVLRDWKDGKSG